MPSGVFRSAQPKTIVCGGLVDVDEQPAVNDRSRLPVLAIAGNAPQTCNEARNKVSSRGAADYGRRMRPPFMNTPEQLESVDGQQYLVLRPTSEVADRYATEQNDALALAGLPHRTRGT